MIFSEHRRAARGALGLALVVGAIACSATKGHGGTGAGGSGGAGGDTIDGTGGFTSSVAATTSSSSTSGSIPTSLTCPTKAQSLLVLDFRSGWWSGGGGGEFHQVALGALVGACPATPTTVEYHHFEQMLRVKCVVGTTGGPGCTQSFDAIPTTSQQVLALFDKPNWDDYTQVWILSGSQLDATDVTLTGALFDHFLQQTKGSCIPVLVGAGDGFITHGNWVLNELGLGNALATDFPTPGFFSVAMDPNVTIQSTMKAGQELTDHVLFQGVDSIADGVANTSQTTHGDSLQGMGPFQVIAHDTSGRPAIGVGTIALPNDGDRPFVIDAGFQRYYALEQSAGTKRLLQNLYEYLGSVGCKAEEPK